MNEIPKLEEIPFCSDGSWTKESVKRLNEWVALQIVCENTIVDFWVKDRKQSPPCGKCSHCVAVKVLLVELNARGKKKDVV